MDIFGKIAEKAEQDKKASEVAATGAVSRAVTLEALEAARAIVKGEVGTEFKKATPAAGKTTEVSSSMLIEDEGWGEMAERAAQHGLDALDYIKSSPKHAEAEASLRQVLSTKPGRTTRIPRPDWNLILDYIQAVDKHLEKLAAEATEKTKAMKHATVSFPGEHGDLFTDATTMKLMVSSVQRGKHLLLIGEPGSGKTDVARALPGVTGRELYHMEVSGLSDVSQLEAERYLEVKDGASVTVSKQTALIDALEAAETGRKVVLVIDEVARVVDPAILNPLLLLMSHGEYHAVVGKKTYRVSRENFVIICTANLEPGRNFSGNNRRGLDDALVDRVRIIRIERAPAEVIPDIIKARVPMVDEKGRALPERMVTNMLEALKAVYQMATKPEQRRIITTRSIMAVADAWVSLDPRMYTLSEVMQIELGDRTADRATLDGMISVLESKGL